MERFDELAQGAKRVRVTLSMGDVSVVTGEPGVWSVDWAGNSDEAPIVDRDGGLVRVRDHGGGQRLNLTLTIPPDVETVDLNTGHGPISVSNVSGRVEARTGWGHLTFDRVGGAVEARTGWGEVRVFEPRGLSIQASTGFGAIRADGGSLHGAQVKTGNGEIRFDTALLRGRYEIRTDFGDVTVGLPDGTSARIEAQTSIGKVESDVPLVRVGRPGQREPDGWRRIDFGSIRMVGTTGNGNPEVELSVRTHHGRISLRWRPRSADAGDRESAARIAAWAAAAPSPTPAPPAGGSDERGQPRAAAEDERASQPSSEEPDQVRAILQAVARGELSPDEADALLDAELSRETATRSPSR